MKVKDNYGTAKIVIPGHGIYGGAELLDYTINMYKPSIRGTILKAHNIKTTPVFNNHERIFEVAQSDSTEENKRHLTDATIFVNHRKKYLKITTPKATHDVDGRAISSDYGSLQLYDKGTNDLIEDLYYKQLYVNLRDDEVEWTIILKRPLDKALF